MAEKREPARGRAVPPYRYIQIGVPYPLSQAAVARFVDGLDSALVLEELDYVSEGSCWLMAVPRMVCSGLAVTYR